MRVLSVIPKTVHAVCREVPRPIFGPEERIFPAKSLALPPGEVVTVGEKERDRILKRYGIAGVVEVPDGATLEDIEGLRRKAKETRYRHLAQQINNYKMDQGRRQARGVEVLMPNQAMHDILKEVEALKPEVIDNNPVMQAKIAELPNANPIPHDPMADELKQFGISPAAAPLVPGVKMEEGLDI